MFDSILVGEISQKYILQIPPGPGDYGVIVTKNGCSDTSDCYFAWFSGLFDEVQNGSVQVFPNPSVDIINIETELNMDLKTVRVFNYQGKSLSLEFIETSNGIQVFTQDLNSGIYWISFMDGKSGLSNSICERIRKKE